LYVQWPARDVLTCRASALRFLARCPASGRLGSKHTNTKWEEITDDATESYGLTASAGPKHASIQGKRGIMLGKKIVDWIDWQLAQR
jgi:hypothetical protein